MFNLHDFWYKSFWIALYQEGFENTDSLKIRCTGGNCIEFLQTYSNGKYASLVSKVIYPELKNPDGSTTIYNADGTIKGYKNKRIYTVEEAIVVSKPIGNTFKIRYK